jgi:long-chain fatty acid transport protein
VQFPTGYADFDAIVAGTLPFDSNPAGNTEVTFPADIRVALAWQGENWTVAADAIRVGWDSFQELPITLPDYPELSSVRPENYEDAMTYRIGIEHRWEKVALQVGYLFDETPVPTASVSPLLPDAERNGYSVGLSYNVSPRVRLDAAYLYLPFDARSTEGLDQDGYNGTYDTTGHLFGMSLVFRF